MQTLHDESNRLEEAPSIRHFMEPKYLAGVFNVTPRTINRWAKQYNWGTVRISSKTLRYAKEDIEKTLNVDLGPSK